jgi:hypothetical protein
MLGKTSRYYNTIDKIKLENDAIIASGKTKTLSKKFKNTFRKGFGATYNVGRATIGVPVHSTAFLLGKVINTTSTVIVTPLIAFNIIKKLIIKKQNNSISSTNDSIKNGLKIFFMVIFIILPGISIKFAVKLFTRFVKIFTKYEIDTDTFFDEIFESINNSAGTTLTESSLEQAYRIRNKKLQSR